MNQPLAADYTSPINQADGLLQRSFDQVQMALKAGLIATWFWDVVQDKLFGDVNLLTLFGIEPQAGSSGLPLRTFTDAIHIDDRQQVLALIDRAQQSGQPFDAECRIITTRAHTRWIVIRGQFAYNAEKRPVTFSGVSIDVTERKTVELNQQVNEGRLRLAVDSAQLGTWDHNPVTGELNWSDRTKELFGLPASAPIDYAVFLQGIHPDDRESTYQAIWTVLEPGSNNHFYNEYRTVGITDGKLRWLRSNGQLFRDEFGVAVQFVGTVVDMTVVKENEVLLKHRVDEQTQILEQQAAELRQINIELKRSNESLEQFAHIASHDLQEPLRRIQSFSDLLKSQFADNLSDGERDMVQRIQKSAQRMQLLIKDLLTYSQLSRQRESFAQTNLNNVLDDVINDMELIIDEKAATITNNELPSVDGNASRLRQLFQNLISNALKFVPTGVAPVIDIQARPAQASELPESLPVQPKQTFWLISVTDNGIGFNEQYKDRIFSPFQRLHSSGQYGGTGIGLAICQRVAQNHGGTIDVSSQAGKGTTFKVFLPMLS